MDSLQQNRRWKRAFGPATSTMLDLDADSDGAGGQTSTEQGPLTASGGVAPHTISTTMPAEVVSVPSSPEPRPQGRRPLRRHRRSGAGGSVDREVRRDFARAWVQFRAHGYAWPGRRKDLRRCRRYYGKAALARMVRHLLTHSGSSTVGSSWSEEEAGG